MKRFFLLFIIIFFQNCSTSSLNKSQNNLILNMKDVSYTLPAKKIEKKSFYYPPIRLKRDIFYNGSYYFIQDVYQTDTNKKFISSITYLSDIFFQGDNTRLLKRKGNLYLLTTNIKGKKINILALNQNKRRIFFLYPLANKDFNTIYKKIFNKTTALDLKTSYITKTKEKLLFPTFSPKTQLLFSLTQPIVRGKRF